MKKFCFFLFMAILSIEALDLSYRYKRQSKDGDLGDRYDWYKPTELYPEQIWTIFDIDPKFPDTKVPTTTTPRPNLNPPPNQLEIEACQRSCKRTSEYNPVCGTDNQDYYNPGALFCAQACGVNVQLLGQWRCPPPTPAP